MAEGIPLEEHGGLKKKYRALIVISGIILFAVLATLIFVFLKAPPAHEVYFQEKYEECLEEKQENYYFLMAAKTGDLSYCSKLPSEERKICTGEEKEDISVCDARADERDRQICKAERLMDPGLCPEDNLWCLAYASMDEKYCQQLEDESSVKECLITVRLDADALLSEEANQGCADNAYLYTAEVTHDKLMCDKIKNTKLKESCLQIPV